MENIQERQGTATEKIWWSSLVTLVNELVKTAENFTLVSQKK